MGIHLYGLLIEYKVCVMAKVLLTTPYDLNVPGGVNNQLWLLYHGLKREGYEVKILGSSSGTVKNKDIKCIGKLTTIHSNGSKAHICLDFGIKYHIKHFLKEYSPDYIHIQEPLAGLLNYFTLQFSKTINIGTFHTYCSHQWENRFLKLFMSKYFYKLHEKIAVSEAAKSYISRTFPGEYTIIPNAISLAKKRKFSEGSRQK